MGKKKKPGTDEGQDVKTTGQDQFITRTMLTDALKTFGADFGAQMNKQIQDVAGSSAQDLINRIIEQRSEEVFGGEAYRASSLPQQRAWDAQFKRLVATELDRYGERARGQQNDVSHLAEVKADRLGRAQDMWGMTRAAFLSKLLDVNDASEAKKTLGLIGSYVGVENAFDTDLEALVDKAVGGAINKTNKGAADKAA